MNAFKTLLAGRSERMPLGTWLMGASPLFAEAAGFAGFDWAVVDMEHSPLELGGVVALLQALAGTPTAPVVRVPWNDAVVVKRVLDAGAESVLFPFVQDADEARRAVAATRYPPQGVRGMAGMSRAALYGTRPDHFHTANARLAVMLQLETPQALAQLEAICDVPGVDALFVGPADLSGTMGHVGQPTHPEVLTAMEDAARRARARGMPIGTLAGNAEGARRYRDLGYDVMAMGSDLGYFMGAAQAALHALRGEGAAPAAGRSGY